MMKLTWKNSKPTLDQSLWTVSSGVLVNSLKLGKFIVLVRGSPTFVETWFWTFFLSYGIKKLQITCVIEDDKVMMDDLEDQIIGFEDFVQSMDIVAFNKI